MINYILLYTGIAGLTATIILSVAGKLTISQRAQKIVPRWIDWCIGIGGGVVLCGLKERFPELDPRLMVFWALFWGHIWIANRERYGE